MKILKMKLENFQGVKELEIDPQGESSAIYGDNGTGKSTVYNAFTWLMYGKPSTTEKNYTPKTTGSHNLHHSVEMTVELADGSEMVLKKDYHEVYKTIKGNPQPVLSGHTTDYSMDGVPVSETQFKKNLLEIYHDEELAKMLTSYNYFLENMKVADRRKILLQVCGDADFNEVIESQGDLLRELPEMLRKPGKAENYYTVDEYRAIAAKEKNLTDKELDDIPQRIDEAEKAKPDVTGLDAQTINNTMAEIKEKRRELESQRAARESGATTTIRQQIAELESQRAAGEAKHVRAESEANKGTYERISNLRYMAKGKLLATMEVYQAQVNVTNTKFQPLGDPQEHEIFTSYGQTLTFTEIVVEDGEFITDLLAGMKSGEMPSWNFQGVIKGRNGSEERLVYNDCVPSGNIDLQNVTVGDLIKRQWSLFVNGAVNQQGKLRA